IFSLNLTAAVPPSRYPSTVLRPMGSSPGTTELNPQHGRSSFGAVPRRHAALLRQGEDCGPELVRDLLRELGLVACQPRPWRPTTTQPGEGAETIPDLVGRDFTADAPGTKLVGDITYLPTWQGFAYLATVIDCCTKECIGYAIADHMRAELVIDALRMAA